MTHCQNGSSHVETPGKVVKLEDMSNMELEEGMVGTVGIFSLNFIFEMTTLRVYTIVKYNPDKMSTPGSSGIKVDFDLVLSLTFRKIPLFSLPKS